MVKDLYQKSFSVLMKRPFRLWGLSLLAGVLLLAAQVGFVGVPAVAFCAALLLDASMAMIYLNTYRTGLEPKTAYLFPRSARSASGTCSAAWRGCICGSSCGR